MKKIILISIVGFMAVFNVESQSYLGMYFIGSDPLHQLRDSAWKRGYGFSFEYLSDHLLQDKNFNIRIGAGIEATFHGKKRFDSIPFSTPNSDLGYVMYRNSQVGFYVGPRFSWLLNEEIEPYIELNGAYRVFYADQTNTFYKDVPDYQKSTQNNILHAGTFNYGVGGGIIYKPGSWLAFDFRVYYNQGTEANFMDISSLKENKLTGDRFTYSTRSVNWNEQLFYRLGLLITLNTNGSCRSGCLGGNNYYNDNYYDNNTYQYNSSPPSNHRFQGTRPAPAPKKPVIVKPLSPAPKPKS